MGNYASNAELIARFEDDTEVTRITDIPTGSTPDAAVLTEVIARVETGTIDARLSKRYAVPVDTSTDANLLATLKGWTLDLSQYHLKTRDDTVSTVMLDLHNEIITTLDLIAAGTLNLPSAAPVPDTATEDPIATHGCSTRLFDRDTLKNI